MPKQLYCKKTKGATLNFATEGILNGTINDPLRNAAKIAKKKQSPLLSAILFLKQDGYARSS
jgi:hypothetical protein